MDEPAHSPVPAQREGAALPLLLGAGAAILASACCVGPLLLLALGISGAWIANLATLEPFRPLFLAAAAAALVLAGRRIFRPVPTQCEPGRACAAAGGGRAYPLLFFAAALLALAAAVFPFSAAWFY